MQLDHFEIGRPITRFCVLAAVSVLSVTVGAHAARAATHSAPPAPCPAWVSAAATAATTAATPLATVESTTSTGATTALVTAPAFPTGSTSATVEYWQQGGQPSCAVTRSTAATGAQFVLRGLKPATRYLFQFAIRGSSGTTLSKAGSLTTLPAGTIATGVMVGTTSVGRLAASVARARLNHLVGTPLRLTYEGARWQVLPSQVGAKVDIASVIAAALQATPGQQLPQLKVSIDQARLSSYVQSLGKRFGHTAAEPSVRLVGKHAVITPAKPGVAVETKVMVAALAKQLATGQRTLLSLGVKTTPLAKTATPQKAVVVRLSTQTLTAYLNGKPVLQTPVTTGRPALPTPIGSFKVLNRNSPYVFHSPWAPGSPYWYPPTPVTWAMEFYDGDFLHDDPGEPASTFGSDSQNGYFASHGCVHLPHDAMAFLYNWLPIGAPVIIAEN